MAESAFDFLTKLQKNLNFFEDDQDLLGGLDKGIRLAKTDDKAFTNARIDAIKGHKPFPEQNLNTEQNKKIEDDIIDELINRKIDRTLGTE
jgi:hypothetical protein